MNYLAHLFLAGESAESLIGNLAGDFVKGPLHDRFTPAIREGIAQHRRIDAFTDSHPAVAAFRRVLIPEQGHWSRVIADVFFDHFLACDFDTYAGEPLEAFVARVHRTIDQHVDLLPDRLRNVWPYMRDQQWLLSYRDAAGIEMALRGLSRRIERHPPLHEAMHYLDDSREELLRRFRAFFPDVITAFSPASAGEKAILLRTMKSVQETFAPQNHCFGCGPANDKGLRIRSFEEGDELVCTWRPEKHHEAFDNVLNGGICGALLDCHSNWMATMHLMRQNGMTTPPCTVTSDFHVFLKRPTPTDTDLHLRARIVESGEDRAIVEATLEANGKVTATCRGTFVAVKEGHPAYHRW